MTNFDEFQAELREALAHLYDPTFVCPSGLANVLGLGPKPDLHALRDKVQQAIRRIAPNAGCPPETRARRFAEILTLRYLQKLTQEQSAERLAITVRHLARQQTQAIEVLARLLWEQAGAAHQVEHEQVHKEISALTEHAPHRVVDVGKALEQAVSLTQVLADKHGIALKAAPCEPNLSAALHPSVLHQALVVIISYLLRNMSRGQVELGAQRAEPGSIKVTVQGSPTMAPPPSADWVGYALIAAQGGSLTCQPTGEGLAFSLFLPAARRVKVLIVDDNEDLVRFYQWSAAGTAYDISAIAEGASVMERIAQDRPDIIVLDLMLPDMDGWELLTQLHEHPLSRDIPIVLCSVVQEEELALALGASVCVSKPVRRHAFIQALGRALSLAGEAGRK